MSGGEEEGEGRESIEMTLRRREVKEYEEEEVPGIIDDDDDDDDDEVVGIGRVGAAIEGVVPVEARKAAGEVR